MATKEDVARSELENWVFHSAPTAIRARFDEAPGEERESLKSVITEFISLGDEPLKRCFPDLAR